MPVKIFLPALSPTMTEGTLAKWLKNEGDTVNSGDILAEVETDKATMEIEAIDDGRLGRILVSEGTEGIPVNTPIAIILEKGEADSVLSDLDEISSEGSADIKIPIQNDQNISEVHKEQPGQSVGNINSEKKQTIGSLNTNKNDRIFVSPLARRMAEQSDLDLSKISGTGPNGRIVKADIETALRSRTQTELQVSSPLADDSQSLVAGSFTKTPNTNMRKIIARRLTESKQNIPHFYLSIDCEIDSLLQVRKELNGRSNSYNLSINDFIIRASAIALQKVPRANASWTDDATIFHKQADISVAVAIEGGLITPIISSAESKGLVLISDEVKDLTNRARSGALKPEEYQGGSFSVSNLGMYGVKEFAAVINPPQAAILAVGVGNKRPVVKNDALAIASIMNCTLSCDHRVVDGAVGAQWLEVFKGLIEDPLTMLL